MDIEEANELNNELGRYRNITLQRVPNTTDPEYEIYFHDWKLSFTSVKALRKFLDSMEIEREYRKKRKI